MIERIAHIPLNTVGAESIVHFPKPQAHGFVKATEKRRRSRPRNKVSLFNPDARPR